jgi:hypothetical protein
VVVVVVSRGGAVLTVGGLLAIDGCTIEGCTWTGFVVVVAGPVVAVAADIELRFSCNCDTTVALLAIPIIEGCTGFVVVAAAAAEDEWFEILGVASDTALGSSIPVLEAAAKAAVVPVPVPVPVEVRVDADGSFNTFVGRPIFSSTLDKSV